jgi:hypothetical protein
MKKGVICFFIVLFVIGFMGSASGQSEDEVIGIDKRGDGGCCLHFSLKENIDFMQSGDL